MKMNRKMSKNESFKTENETFEFQHEENILNCKTKESTQSATEVMWPITPLKKEPKFNPLLLIDEELPEESDDEDYKPGPDDLQDQSEEETGRQSVVSSGSRTSALDISANQYLENFDSNLLAHDNTANQTNEYIFKVPEENIGQRTRSKLCLSDTPLEIIEKAFVPPDITTDMYDFKCDNEDWENFLKEFMQPLPNGTNDPDDDDEADPDYNVLAEEEVVDKEELRRDRAVKISRKELRKLMAELFESPDEYSSDEEEEKRVRSEITSRVQSDMKRKAAENATVKEEEPDGTRNTLMTNSQKLLLDQQLRQHVQLTTQHFLQTCQHPMYGDYAKECKIILASLVELANLNEKSTFNIYNLKAAFALAEKWEQYLLSEEGKDVISHMEKEMLESQKAKKKYNFHRIKFHSSLMKFISESEVFLYPLLLPQLGFRCDGPFKVEFIAPEDSLLAIGLDEFTQYISKNPRWFDKRKNTLKAAVELLCKYLLVTKKPSQVYRHIRNIKHIETNPVNHYYKFKKAPETIHYVVPFNECMKKAPKDYSYFFLPKNFRIFLNLEECTDGQKDYG